MVKFNRKIIVLAVGLSLLVACKHKQDESSQWLLADFLDKNSNSYKVIGTPQVIDSPYGKSVYFDGVDDAIFLEENPLKTYKEFTVEMIFNPAVDGDFEQRIVHMGEVSGDRMLLEIRAKDGQWYFDGFAASNDNKKALIDSTLTHPLGKWHHVAFVVKPNSLATYVNGKKELFEPYNFKPIQTGKTSFGVRLNKRSWFKGSIYKIKVTPKELAPTSFMDIGP